MIPSEYSDTELKIVVTDSTGVRRSILNVPDFESRHLLHEAELPFARCSQGSGEGPSLMVTGRQRDGEQVLNSDGSESLRHRG